MKVKLKLFFKWGIRFDEEHPYSVPDQGNRRVEYAEKKEIMDKIVEKYRPDLLHPPMPSDDDGGAYGGQRQDGCSRGSRRWSCARTRKSQGRGRLCADESQKPKNAGAARYREDCGGEKRWAGLIISTRRSCPTGPSWYISTFTTGRIKRKRLGQESRPLLRIYPFHAVR